MPGHEERMSELAEGAGRLRVGRGRLSVNERVLMIIGGVLAPLGLVLIVLGWYGASRTALLHEQVPYLISGGLLGLGLVVLGGFLYFAHWLTQLVHDQRAGAAAVAEAVDRLTDAVSRAALPAPGPAPGPGGPTAAPAPPPPPDLVVTGAGTMAHRVTCRVVAGKTGVRAVEPQDRLTACRLCQPYG